MEAIRVAVASTINYLGDIPQSVKDVLFWSRKAAAQGAQLVCFPESNVGGYPTGPFDMSTIAISETSAPFKRIVRAARRLGIMIGFGLTEEEDGKYYNTYCVVNGQGVVARQRKIHVTAGEEWYWTPGDQIATFNIGQAVVGVLICYDNQFPQQISSLYYAGAEVLICPFAAPSAWTRQTAFQYDPLVMVTVVNAKLYGSFALAVNNTGQQVGGQQMVFPGWAGIIAPAGTMLAQAEGEGTDPTIVVADLNPQDLTTERSSPFFPRLKDGNPMGFIPQDWG